MDWNKLLSNKRLGKERQTESDIRSHYQRDHDRIVFSSSFRRMQDKTQVFPLAESDYVRTRLTHSVEVSCVGRSLGTLVGERVKQRHPEIRISAQDFGTIVASACLAHDIGNPPFGHSGEEAIGSWFKEWLAGDGKVYASTLTDAQRKDLEYFEGNAQGLRVLTRLQSAMDEGGLQLTYATLGTFAKYPASSIHMVADSKNELVSEKKFGYFQSDAVTFEKIAHEVGLVKKRDGVWCRHPLAFLMEAADDICYRIIDLEDGHRLGRVSFKETEELLRPVAFPDGAAGDSYSRIPQEKGKVEYLRAVAISTLIYAAVDVFGNNYDEIVNGNFEADLISKTTYADQLKKIKTLSKEKVYATPSVLHIEAAGFRILGGLLERAIPAIISDKPASPASKKMQQLIPAQFLSKGSVYERLIAATDYVSSMTDSYALTLYKRLTGIELPRG